MEAIAYVWSRMVMDLFTRARVKIVEPTKRNDTYQLSKSGRCDNLIGCLCFRNLRELSVLFSVLAILTSLSKYFTSTVTTSWTFDVLQSHIKY